MARYLSSGLIFLLGLLGIVFLNTPTSISNAQLLDGETAIQNNVQNTNSSVHYAGRFTNTTLNVGGSVVLENVVITSNSISGYINFTHNPNFSSVLCGANNFTGTRSGNNFQFSFTSNDPDPGCSITHGVQYNVSGTLSGDEIINGTFSAPAFNQSGIFNAKQTIRSNGRFFNNALTLDGNVYVDLAVWSNYVAGYINFTGDAGETLCGAGSFVGSRSGNNISFSFLSSDPDPGCHIIDNERFDVSATLSGNNLINGVYNLPTYSQGGTFSTSGPPVVTPTPVPPSPPSVPTNVQATDGSHTDKVRITWNSVSGATSYIVYRNTSNSSSGRVQLGTISSTTYDDTSAQAGQTYHYWVRARNNAGTSGYSASNSGYRANIAPTGKTLNVRYVDQVYAQQTAAAGGIWLLCGPSSAAMLLHYKGLEQRDVFTNRQATQDLCGMMNASGTGTCSSGLTWHQPMINILQGRGLNVFARYTKPTFTEIRQSIDRNNPIIMGLNIGHLVLVVGYDNTNQQIIIHDPFGRKSWWNESHNWWRGATNMPHTGSPKTVGRNIAYTYSEFSPLISSSFFVQGSLSAIPATTANWNSTLESGNVSIQLGGRARFGNIQQATFEPLLSPSNAVLNYDGTWESFILSAENSVGESIEYSEEPFSVEVVFDPDWLQQLRTDVGVIAESGQLTWQHKKVEASVLRWDEKKQAWSEVESEVDLSNGVVRFDENRFGEYTLAFTVNNLIYLPLITQ